MTSGSTKKESISGSVTIENNTIVWTYKDDILERIDLADIFIIGEFTTEADAYLDDWFMVFVKKDGSFVQIPFYVNGREELINFLNNNLDMQPAWGALAGSIKWETIVVYPDSLRNQPLFYLKPMDNYNPPKSFFSKLLHGLGLGKYNTDQQIVLSQPVLEFIKSASR